MNLQRREEIREISASLRIMSLNGAADAIDELLAHIDTLEQTAAERVIASGSRGPTPDYTGEGSAWVPPKCQPIPTSGQREKDVWNDGFAHGWKAGFNDDERKPVEASAVVVPPLTPEWCDEIWRNAPRNVLTWAVIEWICKQDRERFRTIPADRVLGEGVGALRRFAERCAQRDHQPDEHIGSAKCVACEAEDALRANQGGA